MRLTMKYVCESCVFSVKVSSYASQASHRCIVIMLLVAFRMISAGRFLPKLKKKKENVHSDRLYAGFLGADFFFSFLLLFIHCDSCTINILRKRKNNDNSDKQPSLSIKTITTELRRIRADEKRSIQFNSYVYELPINVEDSLFLIFLSFDKPFNHRHTASVQFYPTTTTWSPLRIYTPTIVRSPLILWL